jgi:hypothetical protein
MKSVPADNPVSVCAVHPGELNFAPVPSPLPAGQVANNLYHTTELPGVLVIAISSMIPGDTLVTKDTAQYQWFEDTLKQVCACASRFCYLVKSRTRPPAQNTLYCC